MTTSISDKTKISLPIGIAWSVVLSTVAASVWITTLILNLQYKIETLYVGNQREHHEIVEKLAVVEKKTSNTVSKAELENVMLAVYSLVASNRIDYATESMVRTKIRDNMP